MRIHGPFFVAITVLATSAFSGSTIGAERPSAAIAEQYFRGIYGCQPDVVEDLGATDITVTYPVFEKLFGTPALVGHEAVSSFAEHFCRKWADPELVLHEAISEGNRVVMVWSFSARDTDAPAGTPRSAWGGITLIELDEGGKIEAEIGEESTPGPMGRLAPSTRK
jgi:hypothetical protein